MHAGRDVDSQGFLTFYTTSFTTALLAETLTFGVFTLLIVLSTYLLARKGLNAVANRSLLGITILMYVAAAIHLASRIDSFYLLVSRKTYTFNNIFYSPLHQCMPTALLVLDIILSDAIVLWRAWIIWSHNRAIQTVSVVLITSTLVLSTLNSRNVCGVNSVQRPFGQVPVSASFSDGALGTAAFTLSLATNLWSTCLVAYKAWRHRRFIKAHLQMGSTRTRTEKVMALLFESGIVYCLVWIFVVAYSVNGLLPKRVGPQDDSEPITDAGDNFVKGAFIQLIGIYPTVVIILVCLERTHCDWNFTYLFQSTSRTTRDPSSPYNGHHAGGIAEIGALFEYAG
ncbi:hypothetical protein OF83DRAFT_829511 [Amylostereum chailletii]|nr:hypothetical protein OF83DRAFT_829511 [Amylostereum chailletii]